MNQVLSFMSSVYRRIDAEQIFRESAGGGKGVKRARECAVCYSHTAPLLTQLGAAHSGCLSVGDEAGALFFHVSQG